MLVQRGFRGGFNNDLYLLTGFINFKTKRMFGAIKRIVGDSAHIESAKGSDIQNKEYCQKGNDFWEFGEPSKQGERTDLKEVVETIKESRKLGDIVAKHPETYIRYHRGIEKLFGILGNIEKRNWKTIVYLYWGNTGLGKSRTVFEKETGPIYTKPRGDWWDGYKGEETVLIDDFYGWIKHDEMLRLMDRYPMQVPIKGGFREFVARKLYITSNKPWREFYNPDWFTGERLNAFDRRLDFIFNFKIECTIIDRNNYINKFELS